MATKCGNTHQKMHGQHLFCHASSRDIALLQLKLFVVDQVYHGLEGISLQTSSKLGQPPPECPVGPLWLYLGCTLGVESLGCSRPLQTCPIKSQASRPFRGRSSRRSFCFQNRGQRLSGGLCSSRSRRP
jgi:hypothetical protein